MAGYYSGFYRYHGRQAVSLMQLLLQSRQSRQQKRASLLREREASQLRQSASVAVTEDYFGAAAGEPGLQGQAVSNATEDYFGG